jgi:Divergent InlB B-repeat domain
MRPQRKRKGLPAAWSIFLAAVVAACGSDSPNDQTVAVNLSLVVDSRQVQHRPAPSRLFAWLDRWFPGATPAWAQSVSEIASIQVQITGPGIPSPATSTVPVSDPTSGQEIPVSIQAPVGPNRTITVTAFNGANEKIFGGVLPGVNLMAGAPINLEIVLKRLFDVAIQKQGNGTGTVTSTPPGINCEPTCTAQFEEGTQVSLTASASPGSSFAGWAGDCSGVGACTVAGRATVIAQFVVPVSTSHLHVDIAGAGTGTVSTMPSGISCAPSCDADFETGTLVTLTASPSAGSTFSNWSGAGCSGGITTCTVVMNTNQTVTAIFNAIVTVPMSTLIVEKNGLGSGTVTSAPSGINCGGTCSASFPTGTVVTLTPTPAAGSTFAGWNGPRCGGTGPCTITLDSDFTAFPQFDVVTVPPDLVTLTINKSGGGDGTVTSNPPGISCGPGCERSQAFFQRGINVTLTAVADEDSIFDEWQGGPCNNQSGQCVLTMSMDRNAQANFDDDD